MPGKAEDMARAMKSTIAAGIDDLTTSKFIVEFGAKLALPTDSNIADTTGGLITFLKAYGLDRTEVYSEQGIRNNVEKSPTNCLRRLKLRVSHTLALRTCKPLPHSLVT